MIVYSLLAVTILISLACIFLLYRAGKEKLSSGWSRILLSVSLMVFIYLYGAWVFLSVYAKYIFVVCFFAIMVIGLCRSKPNKIRSWFSVLINLLFVVVFGTLSILYFTGTTGKPYRIANLAFPFKNGNYFVLQGGKGLPTNVFHYKLRGAVFAMDIVKLNEAGNRAKHIFSPRLFNSKLYVDNCKGRSNFEKIYIIDFLCRLGFLFLKY